MKDNYVLISGEVAEKPKFSHIVGKKKMYQGFVKTARMSGYEDILPFFINERFFNQFDFQVGKRIGIEGRYGSYNFHSDGKMKLKLYIYCDKVCEAESEDANLVQLNGFICKEPSYRQTPLGREITDVMVAISRPYARTDYIPCIFWGFDARKVRKMKVGEPLTIEGRIQSREYWKKLENGELEPRMAYEVSASKIY